VAKLNEDIQALNRQALIYSKDLEAIIEEMHRVIIGQDDVLLKLILALVADGHVLLEGRDPKFSHLAVVFWN